MYGLSDVQLTTGKYSVLGSDGGILINPSLRGGRAQARSFDLHSVFDSKLRAMHYSDKEKNSMAQKKSYIYRILIGHNGTIEEDTFMYARNSNIALKYCKELYKEKKYNFYKAIKVGVSHTLKDTQIIPKELIERLRNSIAAQSDKYSEREVATPKFITKEEAGDLNL